MIQQTSIIELKMNDLNIKSYRIRTYSILKEMKIGSNSMISKYSGIPINIITARINELRKMGVVKKIKRDICKITGNKVIYWGLIYE